MPPVGMAERQLEVVDLCWMSVVAASALDWAGEVLWSGFSGDDVFKMRQAVDGADWPWALRVLVGLSGGIVTSPTRLLQSTFPNSGCQQPSLQSQVPTEGGQP